MFYRKVSLTVGLIGCFATAPVMRLHFEISHRDRL
jgi:hypothetical protein